MTDRLAEIEKSLVELETAWSDYEFGQSHFEHSLASIKWLIEEVKRQRSANSVELEIQRVMLDRLGIEWTPGEPFVALVEDEITRLRKYALIGASYIEIKHGALGTSEHDCRDECIQGDIMRWAAAQREKVDGGG